MYECGQYLNSFIDRTFKDTRSFIVFGHECRENGERKWDT